MKMLFWKNESGMMLIWFYLMIVTLIILSGSLYGLSFQESRVASIDQSRDQAFYLAEAGLDQKIQELRTGNADPSNGALTTGSYAVTYDAATGRVSSVGTADGTTRTITAVVKKMTPLGIRAAISAGEGITINGDFIVDGRNHDANGNLTGEPGTYGISSAGSISQGGSTEIGGNGIAPADPADPLSIEENATQNVFTTPEEALGVPVGSLDTYKTSTAPQTPFHGIVYMTEDWIAPDLGDEDDPSTGVLIVHNGNNTALLKNVHGHFKGLIIVDNLTHINGNAEILGGAIIQNASGNSIGNGNAEVKYSSTILSNLPTAGYSMVSWEDSGNPDQYQYS